MNNEAAGQEEMYRVINLEEENLVSSRLKLD